MLFSHYFQCLNLNLKKNWNFENPNAAASDVIMLLWLPWKPIKQQVVSINWKYKERSLYVPNN